MRFLLLSLCFLLIGCGSYTKSLELDPIPTTEKSVMNPYFSDASKDYVYKVSIDFRAHSFSGILVVKKIAHQQHRIVFTTEMGNKLMDFTLGEHDFEVHHIVDVLDRKLFISMLKRDFKTLVTQQIPVSRTFGDHSEKVYETDLFNKTHYYFFNQRQLSKIVSTSGAKEKSSFHFSEVSNNTAGKIQILHENFQLTINLTAF